MITAVQRKTLSDEDIRTNQQFAKLFEDTVKVRCFLIHDDSVSTVYLPYIVALSSPHLLKCLSIFRTIENVSPSISPECHICL